MIFWKFFFQDIIIPILLLIYLWKVSTQNVWFFLRRRFSFLLMFHNLIMASSLLCYRIFISRICPIRFESDFNFFFVNPFLANVPIFFQCSHFLLVFSGSIKWEQWPEMGQDFSQNICLFIVFFSLFFLFCKFFTFYSTPTIPLFIRFENFYQPTYYSSLPLSIPDLREMLFYLKLVSAIFIKFLFFTKR